MRKNKILLRLYALNWAIFLLGALAIDSKSPLPMIACAISLTWLGLFTAVNVSRIRGRDNG